MDTRTKIIASVALLALAFASGRFLTPEKTKVEVKTVTVEKLVTQVVHQKVYIKENPDGTKETTVVTDTTTDSKTNSKSSDETKESTIRKDRINISVLAGSTFPINLSAPIYGVSANKNILGPITGGIWVLSDKTAGISLGLNF